MNDNRFSWRARGRSFIYAFAGIRALFSGEHNARIHAVAALAVIIAGFLFRITAMEWVAILLCIAGVFMAEAFNSAIEAIADKVSPGKDPLIGRAKDLAAGAVLLFVIGTVCVGLIIFLPRLLSLL